MLYIYILYWNVEYFSFIIIHVNKVNKGKGKGKKLTKLIIYKHPFLVFPSCFKIQFISDKVEKLSARSICCYFHVSSLYCFRNIFVFVEVFVCKPWITCEACLFIYNEYNNIIIMARDSTFFWARNKFHICTSMYYFLSINIIYLTSHLIVSSSFLPDCPVGLGHLVGALKERKTQACPLTICFNRWLHNRGISL